MNSRIYILLLFLVIGSKKSYTASPTDAGLASKQEFAQSSGRPPAIAPAIPSAVPEVTIKSRLLADPMEPDRFVIAFELSAAESIKSIQGSTLAITFGKFKDRKPVSAKQNQVIEFKLPDLFSERIEYELTSDTGQVIAKGALDIAQLMTDGSVTVTDIRTDRVAYEPGDPVQITILLEGNAPNGIRLETQARDGQGGVIFQNQYQSGQGSYQSEANNQTARQNFTLTLPREITAPVSFEFKIYDRESGQLLDSGEREIPIKNGKRLR